jgi:filamentous hemagglutinin family protein
MKKIINTILLAGFLVNATAFANAPAGLQISSAINAIITNTANSQLINQTAPKSALDWEKLDLNNAELIQFQQGGDLSVLNRINNIPAQQIFGTIVQDDSLYLINSSGILFPEGSVVLGCTAGLSASTSNGLTIGCTGDLSLKGGFIQGNSPLVSAVPEPSTYLMMLLGLVGVICLGHIKRIFLHINVQQLYAATTFYSPK